MSKAHFLLLLAWIAAWPVRAAEWQVAPGQSIMAAIERAAAGDVILIQRGRYEENLLIDKPLTLRGVERPTISGGLKGDVIRVRASDVVLEGLIVTIQVIRLQYYEFFSKFFTETGREFKPFRYRYKESSSASR